jgi:hypothetical protein
MKVAVTISWYEKSPESWYRCIPCRETKTFDLSCTLHEVIRWYKTFKDIDERSYNSLEFSMVEEKNEIQRRGLGTYSLKGMD